MDLKVPYLVYFFGLVLLLVMLKGKTTQSIQVSRTNSATLSLIRNHAHYFELETGCVISCSCRRLVAKKISRARTNWPLGNFPRLGPLPYFPALLTYHVTSFAL